MSGLWQKAFYDIIYIMKKLLSFLILVLVVCGCAYFAYTNPEIVHSITSRIKGGYHIYIGDNQYKQKKLNRAIEHYKYALDLYPAHHTAWFNLGNLYVVAGEFYQAAEAYEQAIGYKPNFVKARMNLGVILAEKLGDYDGAIKQYSAIQDIEPKKFLFFNNDKALKINKGLAYYNMGVAYKKKSLTSREKWEIKMVYLKNALDSYEKASKILPKDYDTRFNLALTQQLLGDFNNSGVNYCKAIALEPMNYDAHYNLAILLRRLKKYNESYEELQKATILVMNSNDSSYRQRFVFEIMNELTGTIIAEKLNASENPSKTQLTEQERESFDNVKYEDYKTCASMKFFKAAIKEEKDKF